MTTIMLPIMTFHDDLIRDCAIPAYIIKYILDIGPEKHNILSVYMSPFISDKYALKKLINDLEYENEFSLVDNMDILPNHEAMSLILMFYTNRLFSPDVRAVFESYMKADGKHKSYIRTILSHKLAPCIQRQKWIETFYVSPDNAGNRYYSCAVVRAYLNTSKKYLYKTRLLLRSKIVSTVRFDEYLVIEIYKMMVPQYPLIKHFIGHNAVNTILYLQYCFFTKFEYIN